MAINANEHFTVTTVGSDEIVLTVVAGAAPAPSVSLIHAGRGSGGRAVLTGRSQLASMPPVVSAIMAPAVSHISHTPATQLGRISTGAQGFRPMDDPGSVAGMPVTAAWAKNGRRRCVGYLLSVGVDLQQYGRYESHALRVWSGCGGAGEDRPEAC